MSGPVFVTYFGPVLDALRALGASAKPKEVCSWISDDLKLSDNILTATNKNGNSKFENQVAWARFYLSKAGYLNSGGYGIWALTQLGRETTLTHPEALDVFKEIQSIVKGEKPTNKNEIASEAIANEIESDTRDAPDENEYLNQEDIEENLVLKFRKMSPKGFEEFCARLLRTFGLENVKVTGKSGDDGIDGVGELMINRFVRTKVMFQCKRYENTVAPKEIRDFRGAIQGRAERGIFLTTGNYTKNARREGSRENATPIELIDLQDLIALTIEKNLGVKERRALEIDDTFYQQYLEEM